MTAYCNEFDPFAAQWLRNLIDAGLIAPGVVDERSITDVTPGDLKGFTQCHFFAGIGGWSYALRLAGVPDTAIVWTGSPPCQPFSDAGKKLGKSDERRLAPTFMRLIAECSPPVLFGEQVAAAIGKHWLDDLFDELEREKYACGAAVLPAASVGAPHERKRLFFGASRCVVHADNKCELSAANISRDGDSYGASPASYRVANSDNSGQPSGKRGGENNWNLKGNHAGRCGSFGNSAGSFWSDAEWISCTDGKARQIEPGSFPVANGIPARVGRLRGYGNAIVPQVAAEFIGAFLDSCGKSS